MLSLKKSKGQLITVDFILAITILIFIIQLSMSAWNKIVTGLNEKDQRTEIESLALSVSHLLIKTPGIPGDWNSSDVAAIGLAEESNVLTHEKVLNFTSLDKDNAKKLLGIQNFGFIFQLKDVNGDVLVEYGDSPSNIKESVVVRRLVLYKHSDSDIGSSPGNITFMEFGLWK